MFFQNVYYACLNDAYAIAFLERSHVDQPTLHHAFDRRFAFNIPLRYSLHHAISPKLEK